MTNKNPQEQGFRVIDRRGEEKSEPKKEAAEETNVKQKEEPKNEQFTVDFSSFVLGLATQSMIMLGEIPNPESKKVSINLDGARQTIDIIAMLEEKTKGNLDENEEKLISDILATLKLTYVNKLKDHS